MIHGIFTGPSLKFTSASREPCLYHGTFDGIPIYLLRQVDNFAVAAPTEDIANTIFTQIELGFKQPLKLLGLLTMFNGLDIIQSARFVKISCKTYITKILQGHDWIRPTHKSPIIPP